MTIDRNDDFGSVEMTISDAGPAHILSFAIPIDRDTDGGIAVGQQMVPATYAGAPVQLMLDILTLEVLWGGIAAPWGRIRATLAITTSGYSVMGSFDTPFCAAVGTR